MDSVPFSERYELNHDLELDRSKTPFELSRLACTQGSQTPTFGDMPTTLPGQARVELKAPNFIDNLNKEFLVPQLDKLAPKLWLVATPRSSHISPLHHQAVRGREIIIAEDPHLHLVWKYDKIFIKTIPKFLLSSAFWQYLAVRPAQTEPLRMAAIGLMQSYSHIIQYESDFNLAQDRGLIPRSDGTEAITWEAFAKLITFFDIYKDKHVSPRYSYGELRLTRLNFFTRIFLGKLTYHHIDAQWGIYLQTLIAPILIAFAVAYIILNAMQVELGAQSIQDVDNNWVVFTRACRWFSVTRMFVVGLFIFLVMAFFIFMFCHDIWFARGIIKRKSSQSTREWENSRSGVV